MSPDFLDEVLAAWNSHDGKQLASLMADDGIYEDMALGQRMDRDGVVHLVARTHTLSSDYVIECVSTQRTENRYATEWLMSGTNDGPTPELGLPPSGRPWTIHGASFGELDDDGRIKIHRDYWDLAGFLMQLEGMPGPASAAPSQP
jgi:steroid delta-isomerase-like uncharacterized protein